MRKSLIGITISCTLFAFSAAAQTPSFTAASVENAASMVSGHIAPGMVAAITGTNLGDPNFFRSCANTVPVPTTCSGISVLVNGAPAPVLNNSFTQVTFQVPFNVTGSTATIQVTSNLSGPTLSSAVATVPVAPTAPGFYSTNGSGTGTGYYFAEGGLVAQYSQPVHVGDTVVMFGTGFGATNPAVATGALGPNTAAGTAASATLTVNNQSVPVTFAGLEPGNLSGAIVGYDEVIFKVPSGLTIPAGQTQSNFPVVVTVGGVASQAVNLIVANLPPAITAISPSPVPLSANPQAVTFNGSGFESGLILKIVSPGNQQTTITGSNITLISSTQFTAQVTIGTSGSWGALVLNPDGGESIVFNFTASGTAPTPTITSIVTTSSNTPQIAQNTWIEVHGTNLAQVSYLTWSAWDFVDNGLPTALGGVSATVNGKPAAIYFVSPTQINILTPLDNSTGTVAVQLNTPYGQTAAKTVTEMPTSPAFLVIDPPAGHVAALHLNYSLLGPSSLNAPGYTFTPATPGEIVLLYAVGLGQTSPAITNQYTGLGALPTPSPTVTIGNLPATVSFAGLSAAGLYQFNVVVPTGAPNGDLPLVATYNGASTQSSVYITVHN